MPLAPTDPNVLSVHESEIVAQLKAQISYLSDPSSCRGVADPLTAISFAGVSPPAMIVQYRGRVPVLAGGSDASAIGLPIGRSNWFDWWLYVLAQNFDVFDSGRFEGGAQPGSVGAYRMLGDAYLALEGFRLPNTDTRMEFNGDGYQTINDARIIYISRWRARFKMVGRISS